MGLLDNLRKRVADPSEVAETVPPVPEAADSVANTNDDMWLSGVERRRLHDEAATSDIAATVESAVEDDSNELGPERGYGAFGVEPKQDVGSEQELIQGVAPTLQTTANYPDKEILFAGLEQAGVTPFPSENSSAPKTDWTPFNVRPANESGPVSPEATPHLVTLDLAAGCTWADVTSSRRRLLDSLTGGTAEEWIQRTEINHAYASLRLLRVGPLEP